MLSWVLSDRDRGEGTFSLSPLGSQGGAGFSLSYKLHSSRIEGAQNLPIGDMKILIVN